MNCQDLEKDLLLFAYEELSREERAACDAHLVSCEACRVKLAETRRLMEAFKEAPRPGPTGDLLAHCRQRLDDALDHEQQPPKCRTSRRFNEAARTRARKLSGRSVPSVSTMASMRPHARARGNGRRLPRRRRRRAASMRPHARARGNFTAL